MTFDERGTEKDRRQKERRKIAPLSVSQDPYKGVCQLVRGEDQCNRPSRHCLSSRLEPDDTFPGFDIVMWVCDECFADIFPKNEIAVSIGYQDGEE